MHSILTAASSWCRAFDVCFFRCSEILPVWWLGGSLSPGLYICVMLLLLMLSDSSQILIFKIGSTVMWPRHFLSLFFLPLPPASSDELLLYSYVLQPQRGWRRERSRFSWMVVGRGESQESESNAKHVPREEKGGKSDLCTNWKAF